MLLFTSNYPYSSFLFFNFQSTYDYIDSGILESFLIEKILSLISIGPLNSLKILSLQTKLEHALFFFTWPVSASSLCIDISMNNVKKQLICK